MIKPTIFLAFAAAHAGTWAAPAGEVVFVYGAVHASGAALKLGSQVQGGDAITSGEDGIVYIKTAQKRLLIIRPGQKVSIGSAIDDATSASITVLLPAKEEAVGRIKRQARQNFQFNTPVAALGVRG